MVRGMEEMARGRKERGEEPGKGSGLVCSLRTGTN